MSGSQIDKRRNRQRTVRRILKLFVPRNKRKEFNNYLKDRSRTKLIRQVIKDDGALLEDILGICLKHITPVTAPLAVISQVQYSGGFLLSRLFDGHPDLYALPNKLTFGTPGTRSWPKINLNDRPEDWFKILYGEQSITTIQKRFRNGGMESIKFPIMFLPFFQEKIFLKYFDFVEPKNRRDVFDAFITSCFSAWLDYQNHGGDKKFTTVYGPGLATEQENVKSFFEIYPEGRLVSLVRKPENWLASAYAHEPKIYGKVEEAIGLWKENVQVVLKTNKEFRERVCLIKYEDLISKRESVMHYLAEFLKIPYEDVLLTPTFNSIPLQPSNGPETDIAYADCCDCVESDTLDEDVRLLIKEMTTADYQAVLQEIVRI